MRVVLDETGADAGPDDLTALYRPPRLPWLRVNMVSTVDGAATGSSGKSGSINNAADKRVFDALRAQADAIIVGAGTARTEEYGVARVPLVLVSRSGEVPEKLRGAPAGAVLLATTADSPGLDPARAELGGENVIVAGETRVDLVVVKQALVDRGWTNLLCEGGPSLLRDLLASGAADELDLTVVPLTVGGTHPRIVTGGSAETDLHLALLLESEGTLLARYLIRRTVR